MATPAQDTQPFGCFQKHDHSLPPELTKKSPSQCRLAEAEKLWRGTANGRLPYRVQHGVAG